MPTLSRSRETPNYGRYIGYIAGPLELNALATDANRRCEKLPPDKIRRLNREASAASAGSAAGGAGRR